MKPLALLACAALLCIPACLVTVDDDGLEVHGWDEWDEVLGGHHGDGGHDRVTLHGQEVEVDDGALRVDGVWLRHQRWVDLELASVPGAALEVSVASGPVALDAAPAGVWLSVLLFSEHEGDGRVALEDGRLVAQGERGKVLVDAVRGRLPAGTALRAGSGTGDVQLSGFAGDSLRAASGTGAVRILCSDARHLEVESGTGAVSVLAGSPQQLRVSSGTGDVALDGVRAESVHASTGTGDIDVRLCEIGRLQADSGTGDLTLRGGRVRELHHELGTGEVRITAGAALGA